MCTREHEYDAYLKKTFFVVFLKFLFVSNENRFLFEINPVRN